MKTSNIQPKILLSCVVACAQLHAGCSSTYEVGHEPPKKTAGSIAPYLKDREVTIREKQGGTLWGTVTAVTAESLYLAPRDFRTRQGYPIPINNILTIQAEGGTPYGPIIGGVLGGLAGGITGYLITHNYGEEPPPGSFTLGIHNTATAGAVLVGVLLGTTFGIIIGSNIPPARTVVFPADS